MKKIITIAMVFCVLLCCVGCSVRNSGEVVSNSSEDNASSESNTSITDTYSEEENIEPPCMLAFNSFEEIDKLKNMLNEDDEALFAYLKSKHFQMNGLRSRSDVVGFFDHIGDLDMLYLDSSSGYELEGILYHVERDYFMATYRNEKDTVRFICYPIDRFVYYPSHASQVELEISRAGNIDTELVGNFDICSTTVGLHTVEDTRSPFALIGKFETDNSLITILLTENDEAVIRDSISKSIVRTKCMDLIEN